MAAGLGSDSLTATSGTSSRPLFSIVTVCRNAERSIGMTIESVLRQPESAGRIEHLVIDGLSTDGTLRVLAQYPHLRVVSEPDAGIYDAMNKGIARASGEYIGILNADDWYEPNALAEVAEAFRVSPEAGIVHGDVRRWSGTTLVDVVKPSLDLGFHGTLVMPINHPASFVRREVFGRFGAFDVSYRIFADYDWVRRLIKAGVVLRYVPAVLTNFRFGGVSTMQFAVRERYRVFRANGASALSACTTVAYSCGVVLRNRFRRGGP
jgi:glycosyltransferase involved in cell wall biosynthesis